MAVGYKSKVAKELRCYDRLDLGSKDGSKGRDGKLLSHGMSVKLLILPKEALKGPKARIGPNALPVCLACFRWLRGNRD